MRRVQYNPKDSRDCTHLLHQTWTKQTGQYRTTQDTDTIYKKDAYSDIKKKITDTHQILKTPVSRVVMLMIVILNKFALCFDLYKLNYSRIYNLYFVRSKKKQHMDNNTSSIMVEL